MKPGTLCKFVYGVVSLYYSGRYQEYAARSDMLSKSQVCIATGEFYVSPDGVYYNTVLFAGATYDVAAALLETL